ncbi:MerR family transcriptional regulator [Brevibacillus brevis]|uniref:MerR family transcriptional regulator n=1 Tax=Brevibacillus brevis TaxID=1393 RepID=UPI0037CC7007
MTELSIGQLAKKAEVNPSTLRYYESVDLLPAPERKNGQRRYDERLLERIHFIKIAQQTGFSIQEIAILLKTASLDDTDTRQRTKL